MFVFGFGAGSEKIAKKNLFVFVFGDFFEFFEFWDSGNYLGFF